MGNVNHNKTSKYFTPSFTRSTLTIIVTFIRLLVILSHFLPNDFIPWRDDSKAICSVLVRPRDTLHCLQEAYTYQSLFPTMNFYEIYRIESRKQSDSLPSPLVLAAATHTHLPPWSHPILLGGFLVVLLIVDYCIAKTLERIASCVMQNEQRDWEAVVETDMPPAIRPRRAFLVGSQPAVVADNDGNQDNDESMIMTQDIPNLIAHMYYASPISILASGSYSSFQNVWCLLLFWSMEGAICTLGHGTRNPASVSMSAFYFALAAYGEPWFAVFCVPLCIFWQRTTKRQSLTFLGFVLLWSLWLQGLSFLLVGNAYWMLAFTPPHSLSPNLGLQWYFWMQLFDRFRHYFILLFRGLPYILVAPVTMRLHRYPLVMMACFWFIGLLFRAQPTMYDLQVGICLLIMNPRSVVRMSAVSMIACCAIPVPIILYVLDYGWWLETGSGNPNYIFFQCLAYNVFVALIFLDFCAASLQRDKASRLTIKCLTKLERTPQQ